MALIVALNGSNFVGLSGAALTSTSLAYLGGGAIAVGDHVQISITYKLKLNGGDMKAVQGDTGHAQLKMVSDVYSHILDEDRRLNADKFEKVFYQHQKPVEKETVQPEIAQPAAATNDVAKVLELLNKSPELTSQLLQLLSGMGTQETVCAASAD